MSGFLLDTHVWWWYMSANARLPHAFRRIIERSVDTCWLSPVSIWELGFLQAQGRIGLDAPIRRWLGDAFAMLPLNQAAVTTEVALRSTELGADVRDPADRFIAATALTYDLALMTLDEQLIGADWLETVSR